MCCFNKVNLSAILLVHKRIINKDCTVKNNNEVVSPLNICFVNAAVLVCSHQSAPLCSGRSLLLKMCITM